MARLSLAVGRRRGTARGTPMRGIAAVLSAGLLALFCTAGGSAAGARGFGAARGRVQSGTGFFVAPSGLLMTSRHVVAGCPGVVVWAGGGGLYKARIIAADARRDLALLSVWGRGRGDAVARYRGAPRRGERIMTVGFGVVATDPEKAVFTRGIFVGRRVIPPGHRVLIVRAALRPGDSGAPVTDRSGALIGMVVGRLADRSDLGVVVAAGEINRFLSRAGVGSLARETEDVRAKEASAAIARISALVQCRPAAETPPRRDR